MGECSVRLSETLAGRAVAMASNAEATEDEKKNLVEGEEIPSKKQDDKKDGTR